MLFFIRFMMSCKISHLINYLRTAHRISYNVVRLPMVLVTIQTIILMLLRQTMENLQFFYIADLPTVEGLDSPRNISFAYQLFLLK